MNLRTANELDGGPSLVDTCIYTHLTQIIFQNRVAVTLCLPFCNQAVDRCPVGIDLKITVLVGEKFPKNRQGSFFLGDSTLHL